MTTVHGRRMNSASKRDECVNKTWLQLQHNVDITLQPDAPRRCTNATLLSVCDWQWTTPKVGNIVQSIMLEHLLCFPLSLHLPPRYRRMHPQQQLLTFLLSHAFVLPGAAEQHQPHSLSDTELWERASRLWSTDNRCPTTTAARPAVVLLCFCPSLRRPHSFLLSARFCGASFKSAADQSSCWAGERKKRAGQSATLPA